MDNHQRIATLYRVYLADKQDLPDHHQWRKVPRPIVRILRLRQMLFTPEGGEGYYLTPAGLGYLTGYLSGYCKASATPEPQVMGLLVTLKNMGAHAA